MTANGLIAPLSNAACFVADRLDYSFPRSLPNSHKRQKALKAQFNNKLTRKNRPKRDGYFGSVGKALNE